MSLTRDVEILKLKAETNRLSLESLLVLGQLEAHEEHLRAFITDQEEGRSRGSRRQQQR